MYYPAVYTTDDANTYGLRIAFKPHDATDISVRFTADSSEVYSVPTSDMEYYWDGEAYYVDTSSFHVSAIGTHTGSCTISYKLGGTAATTTKTISFAVGGLVIGDLSAALITPGTPAFYRLQLSGQGYTIPDGAYPVIDSVEWTNSQMGGTYHIVPTTAYSVDSGTGAFTLDYSQAYVAEGVPDSVSFTVRVTYHWDCPDLFGGVSYTRSATLSSSATVLP